MKHALFYMPKDRCERIVANHNFYLEQATKRLLSQFADIKADADKFGEAKQEEYAKYFNPEADNGYELQQAAYEEMCAHYQSLGEMRDRTRLSVVSGMFHEWEKELRSWAVKEIQHTNRGEGIKKALCGKPIPAIIDLFESLGWPIKSKSHYTSLERCRLVVNAYKHGEGDSFSEIKKQYPEFIYHSDIGYIEYADHNELKIDDTHIAEFSDAILTFWKDVPEHIWLNENLSEPAWFVTAWNKD